MLFKRLVAGLVLVALAVMAYNLAYADGERAGYGKAKAEAVTAAAKLDPSEISEIVADVLIAQTRHKSQQHQAHLRALEKYDGATVAEAVISMLSASKARYEFYGRQLDDIAQLTEKDHWDAWKQGMSRDDLDRIERLHHDWWRAAEITGQEMELCSKRETGPFETCWEPTFTRLGEMGVSRFQRAISIRGEHLVHRLRDGKFPAEVVAQATLAELEKIMGMVQTPVKIGEEELRIYRAKYGEKK